MQINVTFCGKYLEPLFYVQPPYNQSIVHECLKLDSIVIRNLKKY